VQEFEFFLGSFQEKSLTVELSNLTLRINLFSSKLLRGSAISFPVRFLAERFISKLFQSA
jgi:hypothetical protein